MTTASDQVLTRSQRLDRLPFTRKHLQLLVGSGLGWAMDAMDVGLISFVMVAVAKQWKLSPGSVSWIGSIGFVGMAVGASVGGLLADKIGRRHVFALTLLIYGLATGASALVTGVAALLILRFIVGLGLGAELPVAATLVSEFSPRHIRGRMVVMLEAFWAVGWILAAVIGKYIVAAGPDGWRWALAIGLLPTLYAVVVRFGLPESVRFLESKDRDHEAEQSVRAFETAAAIEAPAHTKEWRPDRKTMATESLWSAPFRVRTAALWTVWFFVNLSYYGAFIWIPSLLVGQGLSMAKSFSFTLIITLAQLPGYLVSAYLIEKWGRRSTLAIFLTGSAVAALGFGFSSQLAQIFSSSPASLVIITGCALSFFNLGAWGALYAIGPEIYPTHIRSTGSGAAAAFGRIASILAPLSVPVLMSGGGLGLTFGVFSAAFLIAAVAALFLPELRGKELAA